MNYTQQLEQVLQAILDEFEDDPENGWMGFDTSEDPFIMHEDLGDLLDRANDLLFENWDDEERMGRGYPTEEEDA
jgi:hypothetical protein